MKRKLKIKSVLIAVAILILLIVSIMVGFYYYNLTPVDKKSNEWQDVVISSGISRKDIAKLLKDKKLIRSDKVFMIYIKLNNANSLKAGTYKLKKSYSLGEIVKLLQKGSNYNPDEVKITFQEGINMRRIAKVIEQKTNNSYNDVFLKLEDKEYIKSLIKKYWFLSDRILDKNIYYPLEGFLFPDTYIFKNKDVKVEEIFTAMLDNMDKVLTKYKDDIKKSNRDVFDIITMASIAELEGNNDARKGITSVFYNRLKVNMNLGSDVTTYYACKIEMNERDLYAKEFNTYNPYNTRGPKMEGKLPVGPVSIPSVGSIEAALYPLDTDYLYFVADKNGKVFYSKTYQEHEKKIKEIKAKGDWIEW